MQRQSLRLSKRCGISNPNIADPVEDVLRTVKAPKAPTQCGTKWIDWKNDSNNKSAIISSDSATASLLNVYQKELQRRQEAAHIASHTVVTHA
ncbi:hypothetical protein T09_14628 [Trichinella sp. T9]|nr:hypothetical protein T09_14628 [Trichinella sp. T9]